MAASTRNRKRKRRPYLSYLTNPLLEQIPRQTRSYWDSQLQCENPSEGSVDQPTASDFSAHQLPTIEEEKTAGHCVEETGVFAEEDALLAEYDDEVAFAEDFDYYDGEDAWEESIELSDDESEVAVQVIGEEELPTDDQQGGEDLQEEEPSHEETPLYAGAKITFGVSILLIITFAMRHQLSGTALADLLTLINLHLTAPNCFSRSMTTIRKFFQHIKNPVQFHYYCSFCYEYIGIHKPKCCSNKHCLRDFTSKSSLSYFIIIPLQPQLEALFSSEYIQQFLHIIACVCPM